MNQNTSTWLLIGFIVSFLVVGFPYWLTPYNQISLPNTLITPGLLIVIFTAIALRLRNELPFKKITVSIGLVIPAVVAIRVLWDVLKEPASHNLWPFEIIIALLLGFSCSLTGTVLGSLLSKVFPSLLLKKK